MWTPQNQELPQPTGCISQQTAGLQSHQQNCYPQRTPLLPLDLLTEVTVAWDYAADMITSCIASRRRGSLPTRHIATTTPCIGAIARACYQRRKGRSPKTTDGFNVVTHVEQLCTSTAGFHNAPGARSEGVSVVIRQWQSSFALRKIDWQR